MATPLIQVDQATLEQAEAVGFDYQQALWRAEDGDKSALEEILNYDHSDGAGAIGHAVVLVKLADKLGDSLFAATVQSQSPQVKEHTLSFLETGLRFIRKKRLRRKPLKKLFPLTAQSLGVTALEGSN